MVADGDPEQGEEVEADGEADVEPGQPPAPDGRHDRGQREEGHDHEDVEHDLLQRALLLAERVRRQAGVRVGGAGRGGGPGEGGSGQEVSWSVGERPRARSCDRHAPGYVPVTYATVGSPATERGRPTRPAGARGCPRPAGPRLRGGRRRVAAPAWPPVPRVGDGVIGSPPAFGAVQSRFESESPSATVRPCRRPRRSVSPQEPSAPAGDRASPPSSSSPPGRAPACGRRRRRSCTPSAVAACSATCSRPPSRCGAAATVVVVGAGREAVEEHLARDRARGAARRPARAARVRARRRGRAGRRPRPRRAGAAGQR